MNGIKIRLFHEFDYCPAMWYVQVFSSLDSRRISSWMYCPAFCLISLGVAYGICSKWKWIHIDAYPSGGCLLLIFIISMLLLWVFLRDSFLWWVKTLPLDKGDVNQELFEIRPVVICAQISSALGGKPVVV